MIISKEYGRYNADEDKQKNLIKKIKKLLCKYLLIFTCILVYKKMLIIWYKQKKPWENVAKINCRELYQNKQRTSKMIMKKSPLKTEKHNLIKKIRMLCFSFLSHQHYHPHLLINGYIVYCILDTTLCID